EQRAHVPEVLAGIDLAALAEGRAGEKRFGFRLPSLAAIRGQHGDGLGAKLHEERRHAEAEIGIAIDREFLAVDMRIRVRDRIDEPAALLLQSLWDRLAGNPGDLHEEFVGAAHTNRMVEGNRLLTPGLYIG